MVIVPVALAARRPADNRVSYNITNLYTWFVLQKTKEDKAKPNVLYHQQINEMLTLYILHNSLCNISSRIILKKYTWNLAMLKATSVAWASAQTGSPCSKTSAQTAIIY